MSARWSYGRLPRTSIEAATRRSAVATPQAGHFHDEVQIVSVHAGWRSFMTPVGAYRAEAGDVVVIPARMPHAPDMPERSAVTNLYVDPADPAVSDITMPVVIRRVDAAALASLIELIGSLPRARAGEPRDAAADRMRDVLAANDQPIAGIAQAFGASTDGFIRMFRRTVGTTPARYRQMHRLCKARRLLRDGATPADAAFAASFADQSHLGRLFLAAFGTTPAAYRAGFLRSRAVDFIPD